MVDSSPLGPDTSLIEVSDFLAQELNVRCPLGVEHFERSYEHVPLIGCCANFIGCGPDGVTRLEISYLPADDPRAIEALSCTIVRGEERLYLSHYLEHVGEDSTFLGNSRHQELHDFIHSAVGTLVQRGSLTALSSALAGGELPAIPFNYEGYR